MSQVMCHRRSSPWIVLVSITMMVSKLALASNIPLSMSRNAGSPFAYTIALESDPNKSVKEIQTKEIQADKALNSSSPLVDENGDRTVVIGITGSISKNTLASLKQALPKVKGDPIPAGLIVLLDSAGGDGVAAMEMGRL